MIGLISAIGAIAFWVFLVAVFLAIKRKKKGGEDYKNAKILRKYSIIVFAVALVIVEVASIFTPSKPAKEVNSFNIEAYRNGKKLGYLQKGVWEADPDKQGNSVFTVKMNEAGQLKYHMDKGDQKMLKKVEKVSSKEYKFYIKVPNTKNGDTDLNLVGKYKDKTIKKSVFVSSDTAENAVGSDGSSSNSSSSSDSNSSSSSTKKSSSKGKLSFDQAIDELPDKLKGEVDDASFDQKEATVYITLDDSVIDSGSDSDVKQVCYSLWRGVKSMASSAGEQYASYIKITDGEGNTISDTTMFGHFKYIGLGN